MTYHYTESGLDNVWIKGVEPVTDAAGDEVIEIPFVNLLHNKIAEGIIRHDVRMSGAELRFLRTEMGMTQGDLAGILGVDRVTVSRWETEASAMEQLTEALVRQLAVEKLMIPFDEGIETILKSASGQAEPQPITLTKNLNGYDLAA